MQQPSLGRRWVRTLAACLVLAATGSGISYLIAVAAASDDKSLAGFDPVAVDQTKAVAGHDIAKQMMYLPIAGEIPASSRNEVPVLAHGEEKSSFVWRQETYKGQVDQGSVERIITGQRAELLEPHVADAFLPSLYDAASDIEAAMKEGAQEYNNEVKRVKSLLRTNPDRVITIRSRIRKNDPRYGELESIRAQVEGNSGAVWGDWDPVSQEEIHSIVKWDEWPQLKAMLDSQIMMVEARSQIVREWIKTNYKRQGMLLFRNR